MHSITFLTFLPLGQSGYSSLMSFLDASSYLRPITTLQRRLSVSNDFLWLQVNLHVRFRCLISILMRFNFKKMTPIMSWFHLGLMLVKIVAMKPNEYSKPDTKIACENWSVKLFVIKLSITINSAWAGSIVTIVKSRNESRSECFVLKIRVGEFGSCLRVHLNGFLLCRHKRANLLLQSKDFILAKFRSADEAKSRKNEPLLIR